MRCLCLFLDESGIANPKVTSSETYILAGCMVDDYAREKLKIEADRIKFKYWSKTDIVFHSKEIGRKEGVFKIFKEKKLFDAFQQDLFDFLSKNSFQMFFVLIDKQDALKKNWNDKKIYAETSAVMVKNFILSLLAQDNVKGRLVVESASAEKDFYFHKAVGHFLSNGIPHLNVPFNEVQDVLTEISFVSKKNHDIEEQISDLSAYAAKLKFKKTKITSMTAYEKMITKILNRKIFKMDPNTGTRKKKYYSEIDSFKIMP
ncbi:DUF3800 domain-containing protein [Patescibacteria group bacterium]|nr:DUF3800 domain-containing protein [Patescibacteria group bacterium]